MTKTIENCKGWTQDNNGRYWFRIDNGKHPTREMWVERSIGLYAVCLPGDEPDHATFTVSHSFTTACKWYMHAWRAAKQGE
jgi:hypothetical protein